MSLPAAYIRTFRVGRLYFKYIKGTTLEGEGWTADRLATELERSGYIRFVVVQKQDNGGRFMNGERKYIELSGKSIKRNELVQALKK